MSKKSPSSLSILRPSPRSGFCSETKFKKLHPQQVVYQGCGGGRWMSQFTWSIDLRSAHGQTLAGSHTATYRAQDMRRQSTSRTSACQHRNSKCA
eukprot:1633606-Rhodomonas_salina.1